jgi:hypothetical protein
MAERCRIVGVTAVSINYPEIGFMASRNPQTAKVKDTKADGL